MKKRLNRKGFTLTELCIVMAVAAIVGTMITSTVMFVSQQSNDIQSEASFIFEVTDIQNKVNDWLKKYDNAGYEINHKNSQTALEAKKGGSVSTLTFSGDGITVDGTKVSEDYANISGIVFEVVVDKNAEGVVEGRNVQIKVTAKKGNGTETQTLLFPLFSDKLRERSVMGKNG